MATVYFLSVDGKDMIALDCEESIQYSRSNQSTKSSIFSGSTVSDGFIEGNYIVSIQGRITYSKTSRQQDNPDPIKFQNLIDQYVSRKKRFTLYTSKQGFQLLNNLENCVITDHTVTVGEYEDTILVSLTVEAQFVSNAANVTYLPPVRNKASEAAYDNKNNTGKGNKEVKDDQGSTMARMAADEGVDFTKKLIDFAFGGN